MPAYNYSPAVTAAITTAALEYGVPIDLAFADAKVESGGNPQAVGDNGTSFGLYQLHQGGELGTLTPQQAFDPLTNARVALRQFGNVIRSYPNITDPGTIAAKAQRPADPIGYAGKVDSVLNNYGTGTTVATPATGGAQPVSAAGDALGGALGALGGPLGQAGGTLLGSGAAGSAVGGIVNNALGLPDNWPIRLGYLIAGGILGVVGLLAVGFTLGGGKALQAAASTTPVGAAALSVAKGKAPTPRPKTTPKATPKPKSTGGGKFVTDSSGNVTGIETS